MFPDFAIARHQRAVAIRHGVRDDDSVERIAGPPDLIDGRSGDHRERVLAYMNSPFDFQRYDDVSPCVPQDVLSFSQILKLESHHW